MDENEQNHSAREPEGTRGIHGDLQTMPMTTGHRRPHRCASASHVRQRVKACGEAHAAMARKHWRSEGRKSLPDWALLVSALNQEEVRLMGGGAAPKSVGRRQNGQWGCTESEVFLRTAGETHLSTQGTPNGDHRSYRLQSRRRRPDYWRRKQN